MESGNIEEDIKHEETAFVIDIKVEQLPSKIGGKNEGEGFSPKEIFDKLTALNCGTCCGENWEHCVEAVGMICEDCMESRDTKGSNTLENLSKGELDNTIVKGLSKIREKYRK